ncbi:MAG: hypothetical protein JWQ38_582 [Flavipsychrobacter sp.]|nr:hypothetical protein [Flavipsychrobacter sp.]
MKKASKIISVRLTVLFLALFATITSLAQEDGSIYDYKVKSHGHGLSLYGSPLSYVIFGTVIAFLAFMGYMYWKNEMSDDHMHHHQ